MAIYYTIANHSKREYLCGSCLGGLSWGEWCSPGRMALLMYLLADTGPDFWDPRGNMEVDGPVDFYGRWRGDDVTVIGDWNDRLWAIVHGTYTNVAVFAATECLREAPKVPELTCRPCQEHHPMQEWPGDPALQALRSYWRNH